MQSSSPLETERDVVKVMVPSAVFRTKLTLGCEEWLKREAVGVRKEE